MSDLVDKLLADKTVAWFKDKGSPKTDNSDEKSGWVTRVVLGLLVFAVVAYLAYKATSKGKELAKLKHDRDLAAEETRQAKLDWDLGELDDEIAEKLKNLDKAQKELASLDKDLENLENTTEFERIKIEAIENWDDMDSYIDSLSSTDDSVR